MRKGLQRVTKTGETDKHEGKVFPENNTIKVVSGKWEEWLVKGERSLLRKKTILCQGAKEPGVFKYCIREDVRMCCV